MPRPMRVSPSDGAVDGGQGADLHVVLDHHDAHLRDLLVAAVLVAREAEAVAADHRAVLHHHAVPSRQPSRTCTPECSTQSSPTATSA